MAINPGVSSIPGTLRPDLGGSFEEFSLEANTNGFIAPRIFPVVEVAERSDSFGIIPIEEVLKNIDDSKLRRASGGAYTRTGFQFETTTYATVERGIEVPVDEREQAIYQNYLDAEMYAAQMARHTIMLQMEMEVESLIFDTAIWTPTGVTNEWDDWTNATPVLDVITRKHAIREACGLTPNPLVMSVKVFDNLRNCDDVIDRMKSVRQVRSEDITATDLAAVFEIPKILVGNGIKKATEEGGAAATFGDIWNDEYVWIGRTADSGNIKEPCIGRTFHWSRDGSSMGATIETYEEPQTRSTIVRCRNERDIKRIYTACGALLGNITS